MSSAFKFDQYGCHCFQRGLESSAFTGKGPALDDMDRACLKFHQCQRCLGIDKGKVRFKLKRNIYAMIIWTESQFCGLSRSIMYCSCGMHHIIRSISAGSYRRVHIGPYGRSISAVHIGGSYKRTQMYLNCAC